MKQEKVWRYWCDHCGKGGCAKGHMLKHERRCTLNPQRQCGFCRIDPDGVQKPIEELKAAYAKGLDELRKVANGCPACMLAGIRQWERDDPPRTDAGREPWNYQEEVKEWWADMNPRQYSL